MRIVIPSVLLAVLLGGALLYVLTSGDGIGSLAENTAPLGGGRRSGGAAGAFPGGGYTAPAPNLASASGSRGTAARAGRSAGGSAGRTPLSGSKGVGSAGGSTQSSASRKQGAAGAAAGKTPPRLQGRGSCRLIAELLDDEGAAVPQVEVTLEGKGGAEQGTTDAQGLVVFADLPEGGYRLSVVTEAGELRSGASVNIASGQTKKVTLRIGKPEHTVSGRCLDTAGNPLPEVQIELKPAATGDVLELWPHGNSALTCRSDSQGFYRISELPKGAYNLTALWSVTGERVRKLVTAPATGVDLVFRAPFEVTITGTCTDSSGAPVQNAVVSVLGRSPVSVKTDAGGAYRLVTKTLSWWGTIYLRAWKEGYRRAEKTVTLTGEEGDDQFVVDFVLKPVEGNCAIVGTLLNTQGEPVPGEVVFLNSPSAKFNKSTRSGADGSFAFRGLDPARDYTLAVFPRSKYKDLRRRGIVLEEGDTVTVELVLEFAEVGTIEGVAVNAKGEPLGGFAFRVRSAQSWSAQVKVVTAPDGTFVAEEVPAGEIMFDTRSSPHYSIRGLKLEPGETKQVRLVFGVGDIRVEGVVSGSDGNALPGVRVTLSWVHTEGGLTSSFLRSTVTDNEGWYRLSGLPPGKFVLEAVPAAGVPKRSSRRISSNTRWDVVLPLK